MLRACSGHSASTSGRGTAPADDLPALIRRRDLLLAERLRQRADAAASCARAELAAAVLGVPNPGAAPKQAREDLEAFLRGVAQQLLGGEAASPEEVAASALLAWRTLCALPPPDTSRGRSLLAALAPTRSALEAAFSVRLPDAALLEVHRLHERLRRWAPPPSMASKGAAAAPSGKAVAAPGMLVDEAVAVAARMTPEQAVVAMLGVSEDVAAQVLQDGGRRRRAGGAAAATGQQPPAGPAGGARVVSEREAAAAEAEVFGAKGQLLNKEAGARWLIAWCSRASSGAAASDDTVPTAVARLLLSGRSDDELAAELFDLMGEGVFEHIGERRQVHGCWGRLPGARCARAERATSVWAACAGSGNTKRTCTIVLTLHESPDA